jgi:hypothetical protein
MVGLVKEIQLLDFGRRYCRYVSEYFDKYIILEKRQYDETLQI